MDLKGTFCLVLVTHPCLTLCDLMDYSPPAPLSMEFSRQEYWSGLPWPCLGDLPNPGIIPRSPALQAYALPAESQFSSVAQLCLTLCDPMDMRLPCPSPSPRAYLNSCPLSRWYHPTISSSVAPFSFCLQSFPAWESFPMSWLFTSGGQNTGASALASVLPMNI